MKHLIITIMLLSSVNLFGQVRNFEDIPKDILEQLAKMGVDNSPLLNSYEGTYFNVIFKDSLKGFDFTEKKVGFIYSGAKSNKQEYFKLEKDRFNRNYTPNNGTLYIFTAEQKAASGGYDAAIVYWSKFLLPVEQVIKRLKARKMINSFGTFAYTGGQLNNVSTKALSSYASGVTRWDLLLNSCVGHTTQALWSAGVPTLYLFHPHMLNAQLLIRQLGIYSSPYLYQIP